MKAKRVQRSLAKKHGRWWSRLKISARSSWWSWMNSSSGSGSRRFDPRIQLARAVPCILHLYSLFSHILNSHPHFFGPEFIKPVPFQVCRSTTRFTTKRQRQLIHSCRKSSQLICEYRIVNLKLFSKAFPQSSVVAFGFAFACVKAATAVRRQVWMHALRWNSPVRITADEKTKMKS